MPILIRAYTVLGPIQGWRNLGSNEAYTSKTVSWTGEILPKLGGAKTVTSKIDGLSMPRDLNGARGIFLRAVVDTPSLKECIC